MISCFATRREFGLQSRLLICQIVYSAIGYITVVFFPLVFLLGYIDYPLALKVADFVLLLLYSFSKRGIAN